MRRSFLAALIAVAPSACRHAEKPAGYAADGRRPLAALQARFDTLAADPGWVREQVFSYADAPPILAYRTKREGKALWLLAGIHGEEPAGPNAIARSLASVAALADSGVPAVLIPLCNPKGYLRNWRYPNTAERDWKKGGTSVGDAEWLLPDLETGEKPRVAAAVGPETEALTSYALRMSERYPPALVIDLHEDELSMEGGYIYSQGKVPHENPVGAEIVRLLRSSGIPLRLSGATRFGEPIAGGVISRDEKGGPIRDGSIDELFASPVVFRDGKKRRGPSAPTVIVVETPAFSGSKLEKRVRAQSAVLERLGDLWRLGSSL